MKKISYNQSFNMECDYVEVLKLLEEFIEFYGFEYVKTKDTLYYRSGTLLTGYKYFSFLLCGDRLTINAWIDDFMPFKFFRQKDIDELEEEYEKALAHLYVELDYLNTRKYTDEIANNIEEYEEEQADMK